jgi:glycosyltransferase involved in cell wall biosynthesis
MNILAELILRDPRRRATAQRLARRFPLIKRTALRTLSALSLARLGPARPGNRPYRPECKTFLLCVHEASRTGAPILGWNIARHLAAENNVICLLLRGGELEKEFENHCFKIICPVAGSIGNAEPSALVRRVLKPLQKKYGLDGVVANSVESEIAATGASLMGIPSISLVHEFAEYVAPLRLSRVIENSSALIFSSSILAESIRRAAGHPIPHGLIAPQGKCDVPAGKMATSRKLAELLERRQRERFFLCIGCGYVQMRKGVDLFIAAAADVLRRGVRAHFVWVGDGYDPETDFQLGIWLNDQMWRSGEQFRIEIIPALAGEDLERLLENADAMFLSSRLDPLPNVAIDGLYAGLPVVCFDKASGLPELLKADDVLAQLVVPYFDISSAASVLSQLAADDAYRRLLSERAQNLARRSFDMPRYVGIITEALVRIGTGQAREELWHDT